MLIRLEVAFFVKFFYLQKYITCFSTGYVIEGFHRFGPHTEDFDIQGAREIITAVTVIHCHINKCNITDVDIIWYYGYRVMSILH